MKVLKWIALAVGVVVITLWGLRRLRALAVPYDPSARDAADLAADKQSDLREKQSLYYTKRVTPPMAAFVKPNGSIIDMNMLGGGIPDLFTAPTLRTTTAGG